MGRKDPRKVDGVVKYHPQLVTQGQSVDLDKLAYTMKEKSSLSLGDIQSVLTNLVEAMRTALFDGKSVNIHDFGVFSLSATTRGVDTKDECTMKNIKTVNINFRPSRAALKLLVHQLLETYPGSRVCGHRDLSPDRNGNGEIEPEEWIKACPCFEVKAEFGASSHVED